jgi:hypothetical protein
MKEGEPGWCPPIRVRQMTIAVVTAGGRRLFSQTLKVDLPFEELFGGVKEGEDGVYQVETGVDTGKPGFLFYEQYEIRNATVELELVTDGGGDYYSQGSVQSKPKPGGL